MLKTPRNQAHIEHFTELKKLEREGKVRNVWVDWPFELAPRVLLKGELQKSLRYIAPLVYEETETGRTVVVDMSERKGPVFKFIKHLMKHQYGIEIEEQ